MTISADEFLRRFLLHTLPRGFVRIRFFGFLCGPRRSKMLQLARQLLQVEQAPVERVPDAPVSTQAQTLQCPICAAPMVVVERLSAAKVCRLTAAHRDGFHDSS